MCVNKEVLNNKSLYCYKRQNTYFMQIWPGEKRVLSPFVSATCSHSQYCLQNWKIFILWIRMLVYSRIHSVTWC